VAVPPGASQHPRHGLACPNHLHPLDETFGRSAAVLPLYALGFGRVSLGAFVILITVQAIFIHANVRIGLGPLRWVIATPHFHHWHHAREPEAYNTNFAGEFPVLDALFGTLYLPAHRWPAQYGIDDTEPNGYLRQLAWPLRARCAADSEAAPEVGWTTDIRAGGTLEHAFAHGVSRPRGTVF
jgi:sterol desaturase/sphingolipid hydroxylase (fatty acid hydroxylase superfamily)